MIAQIVLTALQVILQVIDWAQKRSRSQRSRKVVEWVGQRARAAHSRAVVRAQDKKRR